MTSKRQELINKKCIDCCYDELAGGTWRQQIELNPCGSCPLVEFKPKTIATEKNEARLRVLEKEKTHAEGLKLH